MTAIRRKEKPNIILTFQALTFGNGASINFTAPSDGFAVGFPALADAFESSVDVFAFSVLDEFALLEALLSPDNNQMKTHKQTEQTPLISCNKKNVIIISL